MRLERVRTMSMRRWIASVLLSSLLGSATCLLPGKAQSADQAQTPQIPPNFVKIGLPVGYNIWLPQQFQQVSVRGEQSTWRFQGKTLQLVIRYLGQRTFTAREIAYRTYQEWISVQNKTVIREIDPTRYYGARSNANWHYLQGVGVYNNQARAFGIAGMSGATGVCLSLRFDWPNQSDNKLYLDTINVILASMEVRP